MAAVHVSDDQIIWVNDQPVGQVAMISVGRGFVYEAIANDGQRVRRTSPLNAAYALRDALEARHV